MGVPLYSLFDTWTGDGQDGLFLGIVSNGHAGNLFRFAVDNVDAIALTSAGNLLLGWQGVAPSGGTQFEVCSTTESTVLLSRFSSIFNHGASLGFQRSRSDTIGGSTALQFGDVIMNIFANGNDGNGPLAYDTAGSQTIRVDGSVSSGIMPGAHWWKVQNQAGVYIERMKLDNSGKLLLVNDFTDNQDYNAGILDFGYTTANTFRLRTATIGSPASPSIYIIAIDGFSKAGAPVAGDIPSGTYALIDDTSGNQTWLCFNKAGTLRKVQLV